MSPVLLAEDDKMIPEAENNQIRGLQEKYELNIIFFPIISKWNVPSLASDKSTHS